MNLRVARLALTAIGIAYVTIIVLHAMRILAAYKLIAVSQGVGGGDGGDGADNLYGVIDLYYWGFYLFTGIAISAVLLIYWLRRRNSN